MSVLFVFTVDLDNVCFGGSVDVCSGGSQSDYSLPSVLMQW